MILSICQYLFIYLFTALTVKWHFNLPLILCKSHFFGGSFLHHYEIHTLNHFGYFGFVRRKSCNRIWNTHLLRPPDNVVFYVFTWLSLVFDASNLTLSFGFVWTKSRILSFFCQKNLTSSFVSFAITINKWFFSELIYFFPYWSQKLFFFRFWLFHINVNLNLQFLRKKKIKFVEKILLIRTFSVIQRKNIVNI